MIFKIREIIFSKKMKDNKGFKTSAAWNALIAQAGKIGIRERAAGRRIWYIERAVTNDSIDGEIEGRLSTRRGLTAVLVLYS